MNAFSFIPPINFAEANMLEMMEGGYQLMSLVFFIHFFIYLLLLLFLMLGAAKMSA